VSEGSVEYPGWRELTPEARKLIRLRLKRIAAEKEANPPLEEAYKRVMYNALLSSVRLFADFASKEERERELALTHLANETTEDDRHIIDEEIHILERTVALRREIAIAKERQDGAAVIAATAAHELWVRQMHALRLALDTCGLHAAHLTIEHGVAHISLKAPNASVFDAGRKGVNRVISALLGSKDKPRLSLSAWYPVFLPPEEED